MKKSVRFLVIAILAWLLLIFALSSQNGPQTAKTSQGMAYYITKFFYGTTDTYKVNEVHMLIRRGAHVFLFLVLGVLLTLFAEWAAKGYQFVIRILASYGFLLFCCFFDEWHKQFISGRHNQLGDAMLNVLGGTLGIGLILVVQYIRSLKQKETIRD